MIVQELSSLVGGLRSPSALVCSKSIQSLKLGLFIWGFTSLSTLYRSYLRYPSALVCSKSIQSLKLGLFIWGFTSLSTLYRSYHDG